MTEQLPTTYEPASIESRWYETWEQEGRFGASPDPERRPFCLVIPPPNVTGVLHMGHAFGHTHMDLYTRRARMMGREALWLPGSDHAGIATQNVVERELKKAGQTRHDLGREAFVERVWAWKAEYGDRINDQMRRLGNSCDWSRERFTMDEGLSRAVRTVFVRWHDDGLIYRGNRIINWCPRCTTALSDIEVEHEDVSGEIVTFSYEVADGSGHIGVATTRVETMLGDTGVAVHPDDERYKSFVGKNVKHPFFPERDLPIVADEAVDLEFGTGAVKMTPAHDPTDFEIAQRHNLPAINILDGAARLTAEAGPFEGMDRYEARRAVKARLEELRVVDKVEDPYVHAVGHCYRCGTEIEPWLSEQWFVKMKPLAEPAIDAVKDGRIRIIPDRFAKSYFDWMANIRDWCISRQIWWGHRIPVWYCDQGHTIVALEDPTECSECGSTSLEQDPDVLDTWFSSQLWPFSTLGWPEQTDDLSYFYPTTLMVTGYEILYLWVARMIFAGLYFMDDVPFHDVLIHGIVRDRSGKKMSKSLGNVVDPLDLIDRYGADALRFSLASSATSGNDVNFAEDRIEGARNFATKLWNASRFVMMSLGDERPELSAATDLGVADRWILSRLDATVAEVDQHLEVYNLAEAMRSLHQFIWTEYCDWYIELAKLGLASDEADRTKAVLVEVLDTTLRLLHPVAPFITEELWQKLRPEAGSIMTAEWPQTSRQRDPEAEVVMQRFQELVVALRRLKVDHGIPQGRRIPVTVVPGGHESEIVELREAYLSLSRLESLEVAAELPSAPGTVTVITPAGIEAGCELGEVVDLGVERERLQAKLDEVLAEVKRAESKLANESFVARAPGAVVEKERQKLEEHRAAEAKVRSQIASLGS